MSRGSQSPALCSSTSPRMAAGLGHCCGSLIPRRAPAVSPGGAGPRISIFTQVCLTEGAKDECNVVEVVGRNHENQEIAVPVANLKLSCQPLLSLDNFKLQPPVTFRLAAGSGPVHLAGWHQITHREDISFEDDDDEDMSEEEEEEIAPIVPAKKERRKQ
uniref:Nucleophosmin/nucleoplasmin 3 n=1 Tax=Anas platyrhynchos TaxID=8839 RepID=A0A8B9Z930_ANAPL